MEVQNSRVYRCFHPRDILRRGKFVTINCGKCPACLNAKSSVLKRQIEQESANYKFSVFFTLTYDNEHLPKINSYKLTTPKNVTRVETTIYTRVLNFHNILIDICKCKKITYGIDNDADYKAINVNLFNDHSSFDLVYKDNTYHIETNIVAKFNIYNLLAVIAVLNENGFEISKIIDYLKQLELCPGRCELIDCGQNFNVLVDYAFTPNSFDKVFSYAESITKKENKIYAVFGAAGDRDHGRRPGTVAIADKKADYVILSYDDPATENMLDICNDLKTYFVRLNPEIILDRYEAIEKVVNLASDGDTILLLGKGNDEFFLDKEGRIPWMSDEVAAKKLISLKK